jgi:CHAT domain-containing protein
VELGQPARALDFYDRALKAASTVPEIQMPAMTYLGKGDALVRLGRLDEAEAVLTSALKTASELGAAGYQAELTMKLAAIAQQRREPARADRLLTEAENFARSAGGNRILAHVALDRGRLLRTENRLTLSAGVLEAGIGAARAMQERLLLPKLLAELAEVRSAQRRYGDAADLLEEGSDLLEALLARASSPWVQSRIINGARDLFLARVRLEGARGPDAARLYTIIEQARGRALLELLRATRVADVKQPPALRAQERRISRLQVQLVQARTRAERQRLLDQIFAAEEQLAPLTTAVFDRTRAASVRKSTTLRALQRAMRPEELFLGVALAEPRSYVLVITSAAARVQGLPSRTELRTLVGPLEKSIRVGRDSASEARTLSTALLESIPELSKSPRLIVSPDGELHNLPFELLVDRADRRLLDTHLIAYVPSGSVLTMLRERGNRAASRVALAVSASPDGPEPAANTAAINRSAYDVDGAQLRPLPSANDEARAVAAALGAETTVLLGESATEAAIKRLPLDEYGIIHFAVHGIPSTRFPARSALLVRPGDGEDGLLQAREILGLRLRANLVTLSACDTGSGEIHEQEGVASLVRPFLAAGARSVVANAWAADDRFSLTLMREFYRQLASGADVGESLRQAKLKMLQLFGPEAVPRLWSGLLVYGDGAVKVGPIGETSKQ